MSESDSHSGSDSNSDVDAAMHPVAERLLKVLTDVGERRMAGDFATFDSVSLPLPGLTILPAPSAAVSAAASSSASVSSSSSASAASAPSAAAIALSAGNDPIQVSLPLAEAQAQQIKARCSLAPFGRRERTLYDTAVRNSWQLEPDQFRLENPAFIAAVRALSSSVHRRQVLTKFERL
jgi:hypothetical protein